MGNPVSTIGSAAKSSSKSTGCPIVSSGTRTGSNGFLSSVGINELRSKKNGTAMPPFVGIGQIVPTLVRFVLPFDARKQIVSAYEENIKRAGRGARDLARRQKNH